MENIQADSPSKENPYHARVIFGTAKKLLQRNIGKNTTKTQINQCYGEVRKIISTSLLKSCSLDPLPTSLFKENIDIISPSKSKIVSKSVTSCWLLSIYNTAQVTPLLKKSSLYPDTMKNYRPLENLPFVSKIVKRVVASCLNTLWLKTPF